MPRRALKFLQHIARKEIRPSERIFIMQKGAKRRQIMPPLGACKLYIAQLFIPRDKSSSARAANCCGESCSPRAIASTPQAESTSRASARFNEKACMRLFSSVFLREEKAARTNFFIERAGAFYGNVALPYVNAPQQRCSTFGLGVNILRETRLIMPHTPRRAIFAVTAP